MGNGWWLALIKDKSCCCHFKQVAHDSGSPDPLLESARRVEPQSWNRYTYAANNPLRYIDPTGEDYEDLSKKQRVLIDDWARRQNEANKTNVSAEGIYNALDQSQRATFEADANAP